MNRLLALSMCLFLAAVASPAQEPPPSSNPGVHLRIANLLPITSKPLTIRRGDENLISGAKPGFMMPYAEISKEGGNKFTVSEGERAIGTFSLEKIAKPGYHTVVVLMKGSDAQVVALRDDPQPDGRPKSGEPPPPPQKRFRGYFGAFGFPYRVAVGGLGTWDVAGDSIVVDMPITGKPPKVVSLAYTSRDGDRVLLHFPTDYTTSPWNSAFVSQRGVKRPRLRAYPDAVPPAVDAIDPPE